MQTHLADFIRETPEGREAEEILRKCVHCGFCTATCPTYQLLGDELDGPRGRIYLIKQVLEGSPATEKTRLHLDRCLTCRACESTCPSGVEYGRLADIGRHEVERQVPRRGADRLFREALKGLVPSSGLFGAAMGMGRLFKPLLPRVLAGKVPDAPPAGHWPPPRHARRMIALAGCVQPSMRPSINAATARVLDAARYLAGGAGCGGLLRRRPLSPP
jgi:glycolate oxidase iron-sulfur subunit